MIIKNLLFLSIFLFYFSAYSYSQITFQKTIGGSGYDYSYSVDQTVDGGFAIVGYKYPYGGGTELSP